MLEDPEFIIAIVVAQYVLSFLKPLTLFLEKTNCDMVVAFDEAPNTLNTIKGLRTNDKFSELFARAQIMEVVLQPRRRLSRQVHRDSPNVNSAEQLWRTTMYFAFLDHVNNELNHIFPGDQRQMMLGQYLIHSKFDHLVDSVVNELSTVFRADLPDLATWRPEIARRGMKFHDGFENIPISLQQSLS
jgi:hypothetical protein